MTPCNTDNDNEQQIEYASVKFLLKQVYSAHINKVKGLEEQLQDLKAELETTKRALNDTKSDCRQCKELQNAFTICKAALVEQTERFDNIGQKLSHSKDQNSRSKGEGLSEIEDARASTSIFSKPEMFTKTLENTVTNSELEINFSKYSELFTPSEMQSSRNAKPQEPKISSSRNKLQQTIKTTDESSQMLHLLGVTDGRSNLSCDAANRSGSFVLVPDSLDCISGANVKRQIIDISRSKISPPKLKFVKQIPLDRSETKANNSKAVNVESPKKNISSLSKKRTLSDSLDGDAKTKKRNSREGNRVSSPSPESNSSRNEKLVNLNMSMETTFLTIPNPVKEKKKTEVVGKDASPKGKKLKKSAEKIPSQAKATRKGSHIKSLNIQIVSDKAEKKQGHPKTDVICLDENDLKDSCGPSSQNLMPSKLSKKIRSFLSEENSNDNDDFQSAVTSASYPNNDCNVSNSSVKKKLPKKTIHPKMLKGSSKYKMTLDAPSLNYKKPNYKQTKLTKTVFEAKKHKETTPSKSEKSKLVHEIFIKSKKTQSMDFDATCIPENFKYAATQYANSILGDIGNIGSSEELLPSKNSKESLSQDLLANACLLDENSPYIVDVAEDDDDDGDEKIASENVKHLNKAIDSFDKLPLPDEPNYKYKEDTVRNRVQRKQLNAFDCQECEKYYSELGLTDKEKQDRLKQCSRHRAKFAPPPTPDHYWELEFPDTQECKVRGYQAETQKVQLKTRRRRPLA